MFRSKNSDFDQYLRACYGYRSDKSSMFMRLVTGVTGVHPQGAPPPSGRGEIRNPNRQGAGGQGRSPKSEILFDQVLVWYLSDPLPHVPSQFPWSCLPIILPSPVFPKNQLKDFQLAPINEKDN
jgi:hypothetical protein